LFQNVGSPDSSRNLFKISTKSRPAKPRIAQSRNSKEYFVEAAPPRRDSHAVLDEALLMLALFSGSPFAGGSR
jgi:hypothetical protein